MTAPLMGCRVVVTRPAGKAAHLIALLAERGADPIHFPVIEIVDPVSWDQVDAAAARLRLGDYSWVVFTSVNAVDEFVGRTRPDDFSRTPVAAVGSATTEALKRRAIKVDVVPESFTGEAVAAAIGPGNGTILLPRVEDGPRDTVEAFESRGWRVDEVVSYRNVPAGDPDAVPREYDAVTFASGSAVRRFAELIGGKELSPRIVVCIGPKTAQVARDVGLTPDVVADVHTDQGMVDALELFMLDRGRSR